MDRRWRRWVGCPNWRGGSVRRANGLCGVAARSRGDVAEGLGGAGGVGELAGGVVALDLADQLDQRVDLGLDGVQGALRLDRVLGAGGELGDGGEAVAVAGALELVDALAEVFQ